MTLRTCKIAAVALVAGVFIVLGATADAHVPAVSASCDRLTVQLTDYERGSKVIVTVGGQKTTATFDGRYTRTFTGTGPYTVIVDNNGEGWDSEWSGVLAACGSGATGPTPTSSTTSTTRPASGATGPTTTVAPTTTVRVVELIPPVTAPPTTTTAAPVVDAPQVLAATVTVPPVEELTALPRTGAWSERLAGVGLALLIFGLGVYGMVRPRAVKR